MEKRYAKIQATLEENLKLRNKGQERFELVCDRELDRVRNRLTSEIEVLTHETSILRVF
jgi:hypothetical protein